MPQHTLIAETTGTDISIIGFQTVEQLEEAESCEINTNGAFLAHTEKGGWGYVIRDDEGGVRKAGVSKEHLSKVRSMPNCWEVWKD